MDRVAWWATVHGVAELNMTEQPARMHECWRGWGLGAKAEPGCKLCFLFGAQFREHFHLVYLRLRAQCGLLLALRALVLGDGAR